MDASHLQRSAKVLLGSPLSRAYLSEASNRVSQNDTLVCDCCFQLLIPGATCSVRISGLRGNKAARKMHLVRINRYLAKVSNIKRKDITGLSKKILVTCWSCGNLSKRSYRPSFQRNNKDIITPSANGRREVNSKSDAKQTARQPTTPRSGLSLSDFLL